MNFDRRSIAKKSVNCRQIKTALPSRLCGTSEYNLGDVILSYDSGDFLSHLLPLASDQFGAQVLSEPQVLGWATLIPRIIICADINIEDIQLRIDPLRHASRTRNQILCCWTGAYTDRNFFSLGEILANTLALQMCFETPIRGTRHLLQGNSRSAMRLPG
jgi:hypothetical protein